MEHQKNVLNQTKNFNRVAYYLDMGLGKTFVGSEKMYQFGLVTNLLICQKSKIKDWIEHFEKYYPGVRIYDLTKKKELEEFITHDVAWANYHGGTVNGLILLIRPLGHLEHWHKLMVMDMTKFPSIL